MPAASIQLMLTSHPRGPPHLALRGATRRAAGRHPGTPCYLVKYQYSGSSVNSELNVTLRSLLLTASIW